MSSRIELKTPKTEKKPEKVVKSDKSQKVTKAAPARLARVTASRERAVRFYRDTKAELGKVTWPTRQQTINLTLVVIALSVATGLSLGAVDFVFSRFVELFVPIR